MTEHLKAKKWRERHGLTVPDLAKVTGYSIESIYLFEKGFRYDERGATRAGELRVVKINNNAWQRYRMACAGVAALGKRKFGW